MVNVCQKCGRNDNLGYYDYYQCPNCQRISCEFCIGQHLTKNPLTEALAIATPLALLALGAKRLASKVKCPFCGTAIVYDRDRI